MVPKYYNYTEEYYKKKYEKKMKKKRIGIIKTITFFIILLALIIIILFKLGLQITFHFGPVTKGGGPITKNTNNSTKSNINNKKENKSPEIKTDVAFSFYFDKDKIYYKSKQITIKEFQEMLEKGRKEKKENIVQLTFVEETTTSIFFDQIKSFIESLGYVPRIVFLQKSIK